MNITGLTAVEMRRLIGSKSLSPVEVIEASIARIEAVDGAVNAFPIRDFDNARRRAKEAETAVLRGEVLGPLHGIPIGIKDMNHVKGLRTTFGSRLFLDFTAEHDDRYISFIRDAGAVIVGKTNTTEFGAGSNTTNDVFGPTRNPFDLEVTSGGSSGGSAAALATDMVPLCSGNDTGGSLRVPSAFCGTLALRPSQGAIAYERRAFAQSPFQVQGPMARNVADLRLLFSVIARPDRIDPISWQLPAADWGGDLSNLRVAFSPDLGFAPTSKMIRRVFAAKTARFASLFGSVEEAHPDIESAVDVNWILRGLYFLSAHGERYAKHRNLLGPLVVSNYEDALTLTTNQVAWALAEQTALHRRMEEFFDRFDLLICPTTTIPPFPAADLFPKDVDGDVQETYVRWAGLTNGLSTTSNPIVALPCGLDESGMPFGLQIVARRGSDWNLLAIAEALESALAANEHLARPRPDIASLYPGQVAQGPAL